MFASATGPVLGQGGQPAGLEFKGALVSGKEAVINTGAAAGQAGGRRHRRSRHRRSRHRMRGGDAFSSMGGDGKGGVTAGWNGEGIGGVAVGARAYVPATNR
jgi:hypothetical protein